MTDLTSVQDASRLTLEQAEYLIQWSTDHDGAFDLFDGFTLQGLLALNKTASDEGYENFEVWVEDDPENARRTYDTLKAMCEKF